MTFKAEDYEKKMGECPRHGKQVLWLACKHVAKEKPEKILLGPNRIAVCPACSALPVTSIEEELLVACEACVRDRIKSLLDKLPDGTDKYDYVNGLDIYEKEIMKETSNDKN